MNTSLMNTRPDFFDAKLTIEHTVRDLLRDPNITAFSFNDRLTSRLAPIFTSGQVNKCVWDYVPGCKTFNIDFAVEKDLGRLTFNLMFHSMTEPMCQPKDTSKDEFFISPKNPLTAYEEAMKSIS